MRTSTTLALALCLIVVCGCGKAPKQAGVSAPQGRSAGSGSSGPAGEAKEAKSRPPGSAAQPAPQPQVQNPHFANQLTAIQQKTVLANQEFEAIADRYRKDARRFSGDMLAGSRDHVKRLREARDELSEVRLPAGPEAKALYDAYQQWLDNQIMMWNADAQKLAQDPGMSQAFDEFLARAHNQESADLARVKQAQQAFMNR
jgi:hypothetical protein